MSFVGLARGGEGGVTTRAVETPRGRARIHFHGVDAPRAGLILGHGAGGGVGAPDLIAAGDAARSSGVAVVFVEQPYRVAGRRSPAPAAHLDEAWVAVVEELRAQELRDLPLIVGGRSSGARVACRTAAATGARGVLCLAFPLEPPTRRSGTGRPAGRLPELDSVRVPTLVVQGSTDPFGMPPAGPARTVVEVAGNHSLRADLGALAAAVRGWLPLAVAEIAPSRR